jgi:membrane-associated phospholipid phosphatase
MSAYSQWIIFLSDFADQAVIIPLSLVMAVTLWLLGWRRGCYGWLLSVGTTLSCIVASKLFFYLIRSFTDFGVNLLSPSSHAAAGALVYGSLFALVLRGGRAGVRTAIVTSCCFAWFFGFTRIELGVHTRSEVAFGSLIGILGAIMFVKIAGKVPHTLNRIRLAAAAVLIILLVYGHTLKGEGPIRYAANLLHLTIINALAVPQHDVPQ